MTTPDWESIINKHGIYGKIYVETKNDAGDREAEWFKSITDVFLIKKRIIIKDKIEEIPFICELYISDKTLICVYCGNKSGEKSNKVEIYNHNELTADEFTILNLAIKNTFLPFDKITNDIPCWNLDDIIELINKLIMQKLRSEIALKKSELKILEMRLFNN